MHELSLIGHSSTAAPSLLQTAGEPPVPTESAAAAAQEFEGLLASLLVKTMRESMSEEGLFAGDPSGTYGSMFDKYLGEHIAESSGLGIARALETYLDHSSTEGAGGTSDDGSNIIRR